MKSQTLHYAGYDIIVTYDKSIEQYSFVVYDKDNKELFSRGGFEDNNDAFASACMEINAET